ncbi:hypothetical protein [Bradyrhizobium sp. 192]|nr:hypothetical protein [Bradyrhizobium sp. 192]UPJ57652.1 hypothetical protein IVB24_34735 [Bradyrhizobium sp. 192]
MGELFGKLVYDWRPAWDKAREIQEAFESGVRYPTQGQRQETWTRFNNIRNDLSKRSNADRERVFSVSKDWRDEIIADLELARYSKFADALFFFDPTTVDEMKQLGEQLNKTSRRLSEHKDQMLREHKEECFQRIQEVRATHDLFWGEYRKQREIRQQEHGERISDVLTRIQNNISKNYEKKERAEDALERVEANISKLCGMLENASSDEYRERVEGWLAEAEAKKESIEESVRRIEEWIEQDERRRADIFSKQR